MMAADGVKKVVSETLNKGLDKAASVSRPVVLDHIERCRQARPDASPAEVIKALGRHFTAATAATGTATGATAAVPGVTLPASLALGLGDATAFTSVAALYVFALAEIHDVPINDLERRRTLLLGILLGDAGVDAVRKVAGRTGPHWARQFVKTVPIEAIRKVNRVLGPNFVTKYGTKQGVLVLGKQVPLGIGAAIGGFGNAAFARFTIRSAKRAFGPPPEEWPSSLVPEPSASGPFAASSDPMPEAASAS